jgi:hypothetical protein
VLAPKDALLEPADTLVSGSGSSILNWIAFLDLRMAATTWYPAELIDRFCRMSTCVPVTLRFQASGLQWCARVTGVGAARACLDEIRHAAAAEHGRESLHTARTGGDRGWRRPGSGMQSNVSAGGAHFHAGVADLIVRQVD